MLLRNAMFELLTENTEKRLPEHLVFTIDAINIAINCGKFNLSGFNLVIELRVLGTIFVSTHTCIRARPYAREVNQNPCRILIT